MSRTLRTSLTAVALAFAVSSCTSNGEQAEDAPTTSEAPTTTEAVAPAEPSVDEDPVDQAPVTEAPVTETTVVDASGEAPQPTVCASEQHSPGGEFVVMDIPAGDPDGGLVARQFAGTEYPARGVIPEDITVDTFAEDSEYPTCFVTADGSVWWEIGHPILAAGGWVNASYLGPVS